MIIEQENFLTESECKALINFHEYYFSFYGKEFFGTHLINLWDLKDKFEFVNMLHNKFINHIYSIDKTVSIDYFEIVKRFPNTLMDNHYDFSHQKYTSIINLNDDFEGGETIVEGKLIKAKVGKIVTFPGPKMFHGVNLIKKIPRFAMPVWYK
jgi:hypothetical protein